MRTAAPFDWLAFLRQWQFGFDEVRHNGRVYYKLTGRFAEPLGPNACVCLLDDRTAVFDEEKPIRTFLGRESSQPPAYLRSPDWERPAADCSRSPSTTRMALSRNSAIWDVRMTL